MSDRATRQYGIWEENIRLWGWRQKSKPDDFELPFYEEIVTLPAKDYDALLANRAELVALYREAMAQAREAAMVCCSDARGVFERKLDALDARFKKLEGEG
ncbi:MAG: hypothetical protein IT366_21370 [Candidatus Hydrogenedentes bacterium]|nr:hypothetical protein [Candidatus Hydrogenedentota bacterium]